MAPAGLRELGLAGAMMLILIFRPAGLTGGRELPFPAFLGAALTPRSRSRPASRLGFRQEKERMKGGVAVTALARIW